MMNRYLWSLFAVAAAARPQSGSSACSRTPGHQAPIVSTTSGTIHGTVDPALPNVNQYLGIPYAVPPLGERRWAAPELLNTPDADVHATKLPPSCVQDLAQKANSPFTRDVLEFNLQGLNVTGPISEDCLTLSVWAPAHTSTNTTAQPVPVFIFVYGGGHASGGMDIPYQIPAKWVDRTPDHIVVSFNFRVGIFGFPNAGGLAADADADDDDDDHHQNLALLDQRAAVEWCRQNIAGFGGDPARMVLWGHSAGSVSVDYYGFAYPEDPIVAGLVLNSGTAYGAPLVSADTPHSNFTFVAENVGCGGLAAAFEQQLACMRGVDAAVIQEFLGNYTLSGTTPSLSFWPVVDDKVVFADYTQRSQAGLQAKIPAVIGTTANDGAPFVQPYSATGLDTVQADFITSAVYFCPATTTIRLRQEASLTTFRYLYEGNYTNISPKPWLGAYHGSELPIIMGTHSDFRSPSTAEEHATSDAFQDALVAFARDGSPESQGWTPYAALGGGNVRVFGREGATAADVSIATAESACAA